MQPCLWPVAMLGVLEVEEGGILFDDRCDAFTGLVSAGLEVALRLAR